MHAARDPQTAYTEISTASVAAARRLEFWRETALLRSDGELAQPWHEKPFAGELRCLLGDDLGSFRDMLADPLILRRTSQRCRADGCDEVQLWVALQGEGLVACHQGDTQVHARPDDVVVLDLGKPAVAQFDRRRLLILRVPRTAVASALGDDPARIGLRRIAPSARTRLLHSQFQLLAANMADLDEEGRRVALETTIDVALAMLRLDCGHLNDTAESHATGMFAAAERYIAHNFANPALEPAIIARALRCSRTQLYRVFASRDRGVMEYVQAVRLENARRMLGLDEMAPRSVAEIGHLCGFSEPSGFSRSFRRHFGFSPREARQARQAAE